MRPGHDVVVVARPAAAELAEREGLAGIDASLAELIAKAGLRASVSPSEPRDDAREEPGAGEAA